MAGGADARLREIRVANDLPLTLPDSTQAGNHRAEGRERTPHLGQDGLRAFASQLEELHHQHPPEKALAHEIRATPEMAEMIALVPTFKLISPSSRNEPSVRRKVSVACSM